MYTIFSIYPYSVRMWENTDQKKLRIWTLFTQGLRTWSQTSTRNFGLKELVGLKNHVLVNMLLCSTHCTEVN